MTNSEFPRPIDVRQCDGRQLTLTANEAERAALAERFDLVRIDSLDAHMACKVDGHTVVATGTIKAELVQRCAVSAEDLPAAINETVTMRFVPAKEHVTTEEEIEIDSSESDEIEYTGTIFDIGEAVAQSFALAIDPFATGPGAEAARSLFKEKEANPFAVLAELKTGPKN